MSVTTNDGGHGMVAAGGRLTRPIAAGTASTNVKAAPGCLGRVLVTTAGTAAMTFYDNATGAVTGTIIGYIPANAAAGSIYDIQMTAAVGISAQSTASGPAVTVGYS